ncbi:Topless-related protein 4 [Abeliophyllum distichum]|uniref:Topless-related protein 4 n=1 Tax=Abeliophyllum distichum TaxID=126358 RepID=A0ABD1TGU3_9LAMI
MNFQEFICLLVEEIRQGNLFKFLPLLVLNFTAPGSEQAKDRLVLQLLSSVLLLLFYEFSVLTEQELTTFMSPPSATTFLAFHPQDNNIIAIGMDDSSIQIYNVQVDEVKTKLKGHQKSITGFSFSNALNVLVSSEPTLK